MFSEIKKRIKEEELKKRQQPYQKTANGHEHHHDDKIRKIHLANVKSGQFCSLFWMILILGPLAWGWQNFELYSFLAGLGTWYLYVVARLPFQMVMQISALNNGNKSNEKNSNDGSKKEQKENKDNMSTNNNESNTTSWEPSLPPELPSWYYHLASILGGCIDGVLKPFGTLYFEERGISFALGWHTIETVVSLMQLWTAILLDERKDERALSGKRMLAQTQGKKDFKLNLFQDTCHRFSLTVWHWATVTIYLYDRHGHGYLQSTNNNTSFVSEIGTNAAHSIGWLWYVKVSLIQGMYQGFIRFGYQNFGTSITVILLLVPSSMLIFYFLNFPN